MNRLNRWCVAGAAGLIFASAGMVPAAEPGAEPPRRSVPEGGPRPARMLPVPGRLGPLPFERVLTPEQRETFRQEMEAHRDRLKEINDKSAQLVPELDRAVLAEPLDEKLVRDKSAALAELDLERTLIRARALAKVRPSLSEEQVERLRHLRAELIRERQGQQAENGFRGPPDGEFRGPPQLRRPDDRRGPPNDDFAGLPPPQPPGRADREPRDAVPPGPPRTPPPR